MSGPTYHRSLVNTNSGVAWPAYWDNKWFIGDESNAQNRVAVTVDPAGVPTHQPPVFGETFRQIIPAGAGDNRVQSWMDAKFGPDGALYVLDYGNGFFSLDANQKLLKISYTGGAPTPAPAASSTMVQNKALTAAFTGSKSGGVSYRWEFGDGSVSTQADPRHTYPRTGLFTAKLTVTYADGEAVTTRTSVNVGCVVADPSPVVTLGDTLTKVVNRNAGGGCTVDDFIDDEGMWTTHAAFVNHVEQATETLSDLGVLNADEVRRAERGGRGVADREGGHDGLRGAVRRHGDIVARLGTGAVGAVHVAARRVDPLGRRAGHALVRPAAVRELLGEGAVQGHRPGPEPGQQRRVRPVPGPADTPGAAAAGQLRDGRVGADVAGLGGHLLRSRDPDLRRRLR